MVKKLAHQDISALVADIDDDDGVIDYDEYRHFAVLMMQAFRARNFAKVCTLNFCAIIYFLNVCLGLHAVCISIMKIGSR